MNNFTFYFASHYILISISCLPTAAFCQMEPFAIYSISTPIRWKSFSAPRCYASCLKSSLFPSHFS